MDVSASTWSSTLFTSRSDSCSKIAWPGDSKVKSGLTWCVYASLGIVGGAVGGSWSKRGACGTGEMNIASSVFPINLI